MAANNRLYLNEIKKEKFIKMFDLDENVFRNKELIIVDQDAENELVSIHYDPDKLVALQERNDLSDDQKKKVVNLSKCRGIVVDLRTMTLVRKSYPQTINIPTSQVSLEKLHPMVDFTGVREPTKGTYKTCFGGTLIHAYHHNGKGYLGTFKKIDATNSFFGDSGMFSSCWFRNQDALKNINDLYLPGSDMTAIHLFILNDRKLLVDTRESQDEDRVIYLKSYSLARDEDFDITNYLMSLNQNATKPIGFCRTLSPEEVNERLRGDAIGISGECAPSQVPWYTEMYSKFFGGEKVIYENNFGICTLVPPSCKFRQNIMEGKNNIYKLFVDCMADVNDIKELADVALIEADAFAVAEELMNGRKVYVDKYTLQNGNRQLQVLTNLIFTVPINRIPEVLESYSRYQDDILNGIEFFYGKLDDLYDGIVSDKLESYPGISSKKLRNYLVEKIPQLLDTPGVYDYDESWPEFLSKIYFKNLSDVDYNNPNYKKVHRTLILVSLYANAQGDLLYAMINHPEKYRKAMVAKNAWLEKQKK